MKKKILFFLFIMIFSMFFSCKKENQNNETINIQIENKQKNHEWFYFTKDDFLPTDLPQNSQRSILIPWTEAIRISSANQSSFNNVNFNKAFAIVNRLGILCFENEKITLSKDSNIFDDRTAGNLVFLNETPIFSVFKSSFFNSTLDDKNYRNEKSEHLFLLQFDELTKTCYPIINSDSLSENCEITDFVWDGYNWFCSLKSTLNEKTEFSYVKWNSTSSLLSLSPINCENKIHISKIDVETFRKIKEFQNYKNAPERIKNLLLGFSDKKSFIIEVKNENGISPRVFENKVNDEIPLQAKAVLTKSWSGAIFEDGTIFIEGALPQKYILRNGKPVAIRLPKLPLNFVYSDFVISGNFLYAFWEETEFYKTGKSGFLKVNLEETLFKKL